MSQYALERKTALRRWVRLAVCGKPELLEKVRQGQKRPGKWRVVPIIEENAVNVNAA